MNFSTVLSADRPPPPPPHGFEGDVFYRLRK
jgi:hypothetical protein